MTQSLKEFRYLYMELLIAFLWKQWSAIGVTGSVYTKDRWIIDPEALLIFTCSIGRYDARLFDEVLDWLDRNGSFINIQRLRNVLRKGQFTGERVLSAVSNVLSRKTKSYKWEALSKLGLNEFTSNKEQLFFFRDRSPMGNYGEPDPDFNNYGFLRGKIELRKHAQTVNIARNTGLLIKLRALVGVNARCEIILYLLTHESAHPSLIAREAYYSQKTVQDTLVEMAQSGLILVRTAGKEKHYYLDKNKWFEFLMHDNEPLKWINWPAMFSALEEIWVKLSSDKIFEYDSLLQSSELRALMQRVKPKIETAGFAETLTNDKFYPGEDYIGVFFEDIKRLLS